VFVRVREWVRCGWRVLGTWGGALILGLLVLGWWRGWLCGRVLLVSLRAWRGELPGWEVVWGGAVVCCWWFFSGVGWVLGVDRMILALLRGFDFGFGFLFGAGALLCFVV